MLAALVITLIACGVCYGFHRHAAAQIESARREAVRAVEVARTTSQCFLDALPAPVAALTDDMRIITANQAFARLAGVAAPTRPDGPPNQLLEPLGTELGTIIAAQQAAATAGGKPSPAELTIAQGADIPRSYRVAQTRVQFPGSAASAWAVLLRNPSELQDLRTRIRDLNLILGAAGEGIIRLDTKGTISYVNPTAASLLGYGADDLLGRHALGLLQPYDESGIPVDEEDTIIARAYTQGRAGKARGEIFWTQSHRAMPVSYVATPIQTQRALEGAVIVFSDITVGLEQERELKRIRTALDDSSDAVIIVDNRGVPIYANITYGTLFGCDHRRPESINASRVHVETGAFANLFHKVMDGTPVSRDILLSPKKGLPFPARVRGTGVTDEEGRAMGALFLYTDITEQKRLEDELYNLAQQDGLTGLANRRAFDRALESEWRRAHREKSSMSLFMIDIDGFKSYNDHYGHQAGDACLKEVAGALSRTFQRPSDFVARYGGEEFAIIVANSDAEGTVRQGEQLRAAVEALNISHAKSPTGDCVTISLGLAIARPGGVDAPEDGLALVKIADGALYEAKEGGRNRLHVAGS